MMKDYMDGLSVKVFRTFNASITLNRLLYEATESQDVVSHKADYDRANKEARSRTSELCLCFWRSGISRQCAGVPCRVLTMSRVLC
jgi:hypothetical protein